MKQNEAIIFDLDGTLTDTLLMAVSASREAVKQINRTDLTYDEIVSQFGKSEDALFKHFCPNDWQKALDAYSSYFHDNIDSRILFPGIKDVLAYLKQNGIKMSVVTGRGQSAHDILEKTCIRGYFDYVKTGSELGSIKPQGIREILKSWGQSADNTYYIGDIPQDIIDSKLAGVSALAAGWSKTAEKEKQLAENPHKYFDTVQDFEGWIKK
jgi:phosphoglycolate phosphatase-like HAD superfamily hydrolase